MASARSVRIAPLPVLLLAIGCVDPPSRAVGPEAYGGYPIPTPQTPYGFAGPPAGGWGLVGSGAMRAVAFAQSRIGTPYCWGGNGPGCFDCSGLTRAAWLAGGREIPRTATAQIMALPPVPLDAIRPGDILWRPGHVGLYAGQGWVIAATQTGDVVRYQPASGFQRAVRP